MRYLILDKEQKITKLDSTVATTRLIEELNKKSIPSLLAHFNELEFEFINGETLIKAKGEDIKKFTHIIFRGHDLHSNREYEFKRYIVDYADQHNNTNPSNKILVQNSKSIKKFPYYNKIALALLCSQNGIPYFNSYYRPNGKYLENRDVLNKYPLILKEYSGANRIEKINGREKFKKNVFKLDSPDDYKQNDLSSINFSRMFLQEFSASNIDMRIFVKNGKVIAGWKREGTDGFMTVKRGIYSMYNEPEGEVKELALNVARILEADFIAVDIMEMNDKPLLQEISLHPGFNAYENKITGEAINIAQEIITAFPN